MENFDLGEQLLNDKQDSQSNIINDAIKKSKKDPGAVYEPEILEALRKIATSDPAEYARYRTKFKCANKGNSVAVFDKLVKDFGLVKEKDSKADELVALLQDKGNYFHNQNKEAFGSFKQEDHVEVWPLQSQGFQEWAGYTFFKAQGKTAGESTLQTATGSLSGIAKYDGEKHETFLRVAQYENGYVIDLCNKDWSVVYISPDEWKVLKDSPVKFWRTEIMQEIPPPEKGVCSVNDVLWQHLNIAQEDRLLMLAWVLEAMRPDTPYTIAEFVGVQGTAKSTTQSNIRDLIDPNAVNLRAAPKTPEDIFVSAANNYIVSCNNLSHISAPMQDAYCTLATGGGFASRKLYTNFDEALMETKRPVMLNGISSLATAQDLIDRTIRFDLQEISGHKEESILKAEFLKDRPAIMGCLFDLFSKTLKKLPGIKLKKLPRMADFTRLGEAMSQVLGNEPDVFLNIYNKARQQAIIHALDGSPVALAIQDLLDKSFSSLDRVLMKDALEKLSEYRPWGEAWPKSPRGLGDILRRNKPGLAAIGINVIFHKRSNQGLCITIERVPQIFTKNNMKNQHTRNTQRTQNNDESVHRVYGVCQNSTQIFEGKEGMLGIESTPDEVEI